MASRSALLESSPCILSNQTDSDHQSNQPCTSPGRCCKPSASMIAASWHSSPWPMGQSKGYTQLQCSTLSTAWAPSEEAHVKTSLRLPYAKSCSMSDSGSLLGASMSTYYERELVKCWSLKGLSSKPVTLHYGTGFSPLRLNTFFVVVHSEALPLKSLQFEPNKTTSDLSSPKQQKMYSMSLSRKKLKTWKETMRGPELGYRFNSLRGS